MPLFQSAGNGTSTHAGYRFSESSVITHTAHKSFICMCCWYKFVVIHEEKTYGTVQKYPEKNRKTNVLPVGSLLPRFVTVNRTADDIGFHAVKPRFEFASRWKKSSIVVQWRKIPFSSTFSRPRNPLSNRHVRFITQLELSTETISEQFCCELEKKSVASFAQNFICG